MYYNNIINYLSKQLVIPFILLLIYITPKLFSNFHKYKGRYNNTTNIIPLKITLLYVIIQDVILFRYFSFCATCWLF